MSAMRPPDLHHNLPTQPGALIGRAADVDALCGLLLQPQTRLVTLTGPGGVGKTRLALEVAARLAEAESFRDGVWLVDLTTVADAAGVLPAVCRELGLAESRARDLPRRLARYLHGRRLLLVLDNLEHLLAGAQLISDLLAASTNVKALATSRARLNLRWERTYAVPPLGLPTQATDQASVARSPAVALFVERAQSADPSFALHPGNATAIAHLCAHLDGLPLAIELAAGLAPLLPIETVLEQVQASQLGPAAEAHVGLDLLGRGAADLPERQRTLRHVMRWSYNLLSPPEQAAFRSLGVFIGSFTPEAAAAVAGADLDVLGWLVRQSLVKRADAAEARFTLLETVRAFAREQLAEHGEEASARQRHLAYFSDLARQGWWALWSHDQRVWSERLEREHGNLEAALRWAIERDDGPAAAWLVHHLTRFFDLRGRAGEGYRWAEAVLSMPALAAVSPERVRALVAAGSLAFLRQDAAASARCEQAVAAARTLSDPGLLCWSLVWAGMVAAGTGDGAHATEVLEEGLVLARELSLSVEQCAALYWLGEVARALGRGERAEALQQECLALTRARGDRWSCAYPLMSLGALALARGDHAGAVAACRESVGLLREARGESAVLALSIEGLACALGAQGHAAEAARLFAAEEVLLERIQCPRLPHWAGSRPAIQEAVQAALGAHQFDALSAAGRAQPLDEVLAVGLATDVSGSPTGPGDRSRSPKWGPLTAREREVLELIATGLSNREIAEAMGIGRRTAETHVEHVLRKVGAANRAQLAAWAARQRPA